MIDPNISLGINKLSKFREKCINQLHEDLIFSESLWFATWSKNSSGDMIARYLLKEISLLHFLCFFLKKTLFNYLRCFIFRRDVSYKEFKDIYSKKINKIYQTWHNLNDKDEIILNKNDKYFSNYFEKLIENKTALPIIISLYPKKLNYVKTNCSSIILSNGDKKLISFSDFIYESLKLFKCLIRFCFFFRPKTFDEFIAGLFVTLNVIDTRQECSRKIYLLVSDFLKKYFKQNNYIPELYLPYESQVEQTALIKAWKENDGIIIGYIHSTLLTFPGHYIKLHKYTPDILWVHGSSYKKILSIFGWDEDTIHEIKSLRYSSLTPITIETSTVALPYAAFSLNYSINVLKLLSVIGVKLRMIRAHPLTGVSKKDYKKISNIINFNRSQTNYTIENAIVAIGPASLPLEVLEQKIYCTVIHIPISRSFIDRFDNSLWDDYLNFMKLGEAVTMSLKVNGAFICV